MSDPKRAFLDFYGEHNISPVSQDLTDMQAHYARREALYRHMGLIPSFVKGKSVLEFGPGSGHNALYTASLDPKLYMLVDANPTGLAQTQERLSGCAGKIVVREDLIENFDTDMRFDMVMCEGAIPWQIDPAGILRQVARFVAPGGILIITCIDEVSALAESLRRLQANIIVDQKLHIKEQVSQLLPVFKKDLESLAGMSRPHEDWILDQVLQPFIGDFFSIETAIKTLDDEFDVHGSSPRFLLDWTWYKEVPIRSLSNNQMGIRSFRENIHNFMDYRYLFPARNEADNMRIVELVEEITKTELAFEKTKKASLLETIRAQLTKLEKEVAAFSMETAASLADFNAGVGEYLASGTFPTLSKFAPFFGRGQQYLCFIRK
ncbi:MULTISPECIES: class I SAM-dependent methyltransferase [unclassified Pseudodesulfovibrio]|uniref:class I SAM-dependent methyltransferase n=1 Tax=unclassified Pseudodesulfovibrio TaxID=2661612 RepID=UPI000FEB7B60|nr:MULTISPECIES: class I SAM-dependent methyltransferase [unclassified Pseudodesulfovibrio]MCJ2164130.1 class I SAM-dependent methyltransferase [Pseudodesulfovibrio sp. S3-i]RWU05241.1 class I SAM-dependent methyltransferase [Pseudodesulfovibrio sp. S3]